LSSLFPLFSFVGIGEFRPFVFIVVFRAVDILFAGEFVILFFDGVEYPIEFFDEGLALRVVPPLRELERFIAGLWLCVVGFKDKITRSTIDCCEVNGGNLIALSDGTRTKPGAFEDDDEERPDCEWDLGRLKGFGFDEGSFGATGLRLINDAIALGNDFFQLVYSFHLFDLVFSQIRQY